MKTKMPKNYENWTKVNNLVFELMSDMLESELRVMLCAIRKIAGWHKTGPEPISISQFREMTGLSVNGVRDGIAAAIERGWLKCTKPEEDWQTRLFTIDYAEAITEEGMSLDDIGVSRRDTTKERERNYKEKR